jgi:hypothetical protein
MAVGPLPIFALHPAHSPPAPPAVRYNLSPPVTCLLVGLGVVEYGLCVVAEARHQAAVDRSTCVSFPADIPSPRLLLSWHLFNFQKYFFPHPPPCLNQHGSRSQAWRALFVAILVAIDVQKYLCHVVERQIHRSRGSLISSCPAMHTVPS